MSGTSQIQWTDKTWNPTVGCTRVSAGCDHCYAFQLHDQRHIAWKRGRWDSAPAQYHKPFSRVQLLPERLSDPLHWRKPRRVFVNSMSDLFHPDVPDNFICRVFETMLFAEKHTFQVLTKRPERMRQFVTEVWPQWATLYETPVLPNVWLGVSVENQAAADERIPLLLQTPAAVRFLSCEPLLERIDIDQYLGIEAIEPEYPWDRREYDRIEPSGIGWVIVGGESGPHARPFYPEWTLIEECQAAGVPVFVKQMGTVWAKQHSAHDRHGGDIEEWHPYYRVREFPQAAAMEVAQ